MTIDYKLDAYEFALRQWAKRVEDRKMDPFAGPMVEPKAAAYFLTTEIEVWAADRIRCRVMDFQPSKN